MDEQEKGSAGTTRPEVLSMIAQATAALTKLKPLWRDNNTSLRLKAKLMRSLVICIYPYDCKSLTWTADYPLYLFPDRFFFIFIIFFLSFLCLSFS